MWFVILEEIWLNLGRGTRKQILDGGPTPHSLDAGDLEAGIPIPRIAEDGQEIHFTENCSVYGGGGSLQPSECAKLKIYCQRQLKECT